jgi:Circularly permutated YpsA SLOG family
MDHTSDQQPQGDVQGMRHAVRFCDHIISGGQTGADRAAALDFAIEHGYPHGGWAPSGRQAEDGVIPLKYQLTELADGGYLQRNKRNVLDSDGTLIVNLGELDGGTLTTRGFAQRLGKPYLLAPIDAGTLQETATLVLGWIGQHSIACLNVAGPRESKRPDIYHATYELLELVAAESCKEKGMTDNADETMRPAENGEA